MTHVILENRDSRTSGDQAQCRWSCWKQNHLISTVGFVPDVQLLFPGSTPRLNARGIYLLLWKSSDPDYFLLHFTYKVGNCRDPIFPEFTSGNRFNIWTCCSSPSFCSRHSACKPWLCSLFRWDYSLWISLCDKSEPQPPDRKHSPASSWVVQWQWSFVGSLAASQLTVRSHPPRRSRPPSHTSYCKTLRK